MINDHLFQKLNQSNQAFDEEEEGKDHGKDEEDGQHQEDGQPTLTGTDIGGDVDWEEQWNTDAEDGDNAIGSEEGGGCTLSQVFILLTILKSNLRRRCAICRLVVNREIVL